MEDRLLTKAEVFKSIEEISHYDLREAQDAKTARLVSAEIFRELEEDCQHYKEILPEGLKVFKRMCQTCYAEIKAKWEAKNG